MAEENPQQLFTWEQCTKCYPSVFHLLCEVCKNAIREKTESTNGFCSKCAGLLVPCAPYVLAIVWYIDLNNQVHRFLDGWIKVCCVCLNPIKLSGPMVLPSYVCQNCQIISERNWTLIFRNPSKKRRFVEFPAV